MFELIPGFANFLIWEQKSKDTIDFKKVYVDMAGDLLSGLLLSQIIFWYLPDKDGKNKLRVEKEGTFWLVKSRAEWWEEIRMAPREVDAALKHLREAGIIETRVWKFAGNPTTHIRILPEGFMDALNGVTKGERERPKGKFQREGRRGKKRTEEAGGLLQICDNGSFPKSEITDSHLYENQDIIEVAQGNLTSEGSSTETTTETTRENEQRPLPQAPGDSTSSVSEEEKIPPVIASKQILAVADSPFARARRQRHNIPEPKKGSTP